MKTGYSSKAKLIVTALSAAAMCGLTANGALVGFWDFNADTSTTGSGGLKDQSANLDGTAADATLTPGDNGGFSTDVPAVLAGANARSLDLPGTDDYFIVDTYSGGASENDFDISTSTGFSLAFWIKGWAGNPFSWPGVVSKGNLTNNGWELRARGRGAGDYAEMGLWSTAGKLDNYDGILLGDDPGWKHVVVTYDGSNIKFYKNGSLVNTVATTVVPADNTGNLVVGTRQITLTGGSNASNIMIDDLGIWNEVIDLATITSLADGTFRIYPAPAAGTVFILK